MNRLFCSFALAIAFVALGSSVSPVSAQGPWSYGGWRGGFYGGYNFQSNLNQPTLPYYALYPPVYYSGEIYRRPYGTSPFATYDYSHDYRANARAAAMPAAAPVQPLLVVNPYYVPAATQTAASEEQSLQITPVSQNGSAPQEQRPQGILILNPHVRQKDRVASTDR